MKNYIKNIKEDIGVILIVAAAIELFIMFMTGALLAQAPHALPYAFEMVTIEAIAFVATVTALFFMTLSHAVKKSSA